MPSKHFNSSDSDEEWNETQKSTKRRKLNHNNSSSGTGNVSGLLEEGEISSDDLNDEEDDGLDENLLGGEEDKRKLAKMSEKEREEELFKRAERRDAIQARRAVKQKLKERKDKEKAERSSASTTSGEARRSAYSNVFSSDDDAPQSDFTDAVGPRGIRSRKLALEKRKEAHSHKFHELIQKRRQQAAKKQRIYSEDADGDTSISTRHQKDASSSESDSDFDRKKSKGQTDRTGKRGQSMSAQIFSDASDSSTSSPDTRAVPRRPSFSSSSESGRSGSSSDDDERGRSRSPEVALVTSLDQLSRLRLSRFKLEKWVHMPFFDDLVKGCFVRINIGLSQGVPVYRVAEVVEATETPKIYDLGSTRTNKGIVVRVAKDQSTFRLAFVSNSDFTPDEFESWLRRMSDANMKTPSLSFVERKVAEIQDAITRPIKDERVVEQIIQSKLRFQRAPTNFAIRKTELLKLREQAETEGDTAAIQRYDMELEDIEAQAERIERRRTLGFKSITSINQRNRALSLQQAEEAIRKESEEAQHSKEDDPFTRVHSQPVIVTKKYLEQLRDKRTGAKRQQEGDDSLAQSASDISLNHTSAANNTLDSNATPHKVDWSLGDESLNNNSLATTPHDSLHSIHNFEININLHMDDARDKQNMGTPNSGQHFGMLSANQQSAQPVGSASKPNRRSLNLQEYKKRMGFI